MPSRRRHWTDTRLRIKIHAGETRMHYQQFDYSTSGTYDGMSHTMLPVSPILPDAHHPGLEASVPVSDASISPTCHLPRLFSNYEHVRSPQPQLTDSEKELHYRH